MEYLTINGALRLKSTIDKQRLATVIQQLHDITFDRQGFILIERSDRLLSVSAEGEISEDTAITVIELLNQLKSFTTKDSLVVINRIRWEINVVLRYQQDDILPFIPYLTDCLRRQENNQLIFI